MTRCARAGGSRFHAVLLSAFLMSAPLGAQAVDGATPGAPVDATGQCQDRTYTYAASRAGACSTHGGLATWWGLRRLVRGELLPGPNASAPPRTALERPEATGKSAAPFTRADSVWINTRSRVYHCPGTRWFGQTAQGRYATERDALESGARPAYGRRCGETRDSTTSSGPKPIRAVPDTTPEALWLRSR
jgi:hypothetical protein